MSSTIKDHEKLFDEICNKLNELSGAPAEKAKTSIEEFVMKNDEVAPQNPRIEKMHTQLRKSQSDLIEAHVALQDKIKAMDYLNVSNTDLHDQLKKFSDSLDVERMQNTKLSADLAKSLEMNLKLQLEIQEIKAKSSSLINEEKKYSQFMNEKNRTLQKQIELSEAFKEETIAELRKAKESFQIEMQNWMLKENDWRHQMEAKMGEISDLNQETAELNQQISGHLESLSRLNQVNKELQAQLHAFESRASSDRHTIDSLRNEIHECNHTMQIRENEVELLRQEMKTMGNSFTAQMNEKESQIEQISGSLNEFEAHHQQQNEVLKNLMEVAEKKIIELKIALDKKTIESQDYHSNLQQALTQSNILKQENSALKDYISKLNQIQNQNYIESTQSVPESFV